MNRLDLFPTPIVGLHRVVSRQLGDSRGYLARAFCAEELSAAGWPGPTAVKTSMFRLFSQSARLSGSAKSSSGTGNLGCNPMDARDQVTGPG